MLRRRGLLAFIVAFMILLLLGLGRAHVAREGLSNAVGVERVVFAAEALTATVTPSSTATASPTLTPTPTGTVINTVAATAPATVTPTTTAMPTTTATPTATATLLPGPIVLGPRSYKTAPGDLPSFIVEQRPGEMGEGSLFVSMFNRRSGLKSYHLILDNNGDLVYYQRLTNIISSTDFKKQPNGLLTYFSPEQDDVTYVVMNNNYQPVQKIRTAPDPDTGKEYVMDNHGLQLLENGNALFMIHDRRIIDLSQIVPGGSKEALVIGCVIQEVDSLNNLVFQWRSWDHIGLPDTYVPFERQPLRYTHCNSVEEDNDGNLLVSNRNLYEVTKINRESGEIMWRLGGRKNEFAFLNDGGFSIQHDARRLDNGHITVYDNGDVDAGVDSRGVEYRVDETNMTVEKVTEFGNTPQTIAQYMGNVQRLPNGNTLIGWGSSSEPVFTEFGESGEKVLEFTSVENMTSYRAFRFPWQGYPLWAPKLVAANEGNMAHLYFSWNGSTETASYYVDGGRDPEAMSTLAWVTKNGFETEFSREMTEDGLWYFKVRPVSHNGVVGPPSNVAMVLANGEPTYLPLVGR